FVGIVSTLFRMFYYNNREENVTPGETNKYGVAVIIIMLVIISITGLYMPDGIFNLMVDAQNVITGGI
ncbi:MAG: hydrogenase 4 subunit F, partial [Peptostreptococcaceae bacterium]|nr:hydrogenase 4 subunit F [Peptostreptococcaceae bacterium]MBK5263419.1 hydrogenase 4 subunit F [Peptostreptococcaceae bacterium]